MHTKIKETLMKSTYIYRYVPMQISCRRILSIYVFKTNVLSVRNFRLQIKRQCKPQLGRHLMQFSIKLLKVYYYWIVLLFNTIRDVILDPCKIILF